MPSRPRCACKFSRGESSERGQSAQAGLGMRHRLASCERVRDDARPLRMNPAPHMSVKDSLPPVLRGEIGTRLTPADREQLESIGETAATDRQLPLLRDECAARLKQPGASFAVEYLLAIACALNGEVERAPTRPCSPSATASPVRSSGSRSRPSPVRALSLEGDPGRRSPPGTRPRRSGPGAGADRGVRPRVDAAPRRSSSSACQFAVRLGEAGEGDPAPRAPRRVAGAVRGRGALRRSRGGGAPEFVESADVSRLVRVIEALPIVAEQGAVRECIQLTPTVASPVIARSGRAGEVVAPLRHRRQAAEKDPGAPESFRAALVESLRARGPDAKLPEPDVVFQTSKSRRSHEADPRGARPLRRDRGAASGSRGCTTARSAPVG